MDICKNANSLSKKGISVVIPNYNGIALLPEILPSLKEALQHTGLPYEIIISDDASTDSSVQYLKHAYPEIILIENSINQGFSKTINKGIFQAKFDWIFLLNSDVKLTRDYFDKMLTYFDQEDSFGVMGKIIGWDNDDIQDGGKYPLMQGMKIKTGTNYTVHENNPSIWLPSFYLSGANAFVSREKLILLQGFDELFSPYYIEDVELSLRAWRMGWKCYYEPHAICRHKTSISIQAKASRKSIKTVYNRNKMFLQFIHLRGLFLIAWLIQLIPEILFYMLIGKWYKVKAFYLFFVHIRQAFRSKKRFNRLLIKQKHPLSVFQIKNRILADIHDLHIEKFTHK